MDDVPQIIEDCECGVESTMTPPTVPGNLRQMGTSIRVRHIRGA